MLFVFPELSKYTGWTCYNVLALDVTQVYTCLWRWQPFKLFLSATQLLLHQKPTTRPTYRDTVRIYIWWMWEEQLWKRKLKTLVRSFAETPDLEWKKSQWCQEYTIAIWNMQNHMMMEERMKLCFCCYYEVGQAARSHITLCVEDILKPCGETFYTGCIPTYIQVSF